MQLEATEKGFDSLAEALGKPFSTASQCIDQIKAVLHDVELERNRIQNEKDG
jgi:hypothetical protein